MRFSFFLSYIFHFIDILILSRIQLNMCVTRNITQPAEPVQSKCFDGCVPAKTKQKSECLNLVDWLPLKHRSTQEHSVWTSKQLQHMWSHLPRRKHSADEFRMWFWFSRTESSCHLISYCSPILCSGENVTNEDVVSIWNCNVSLASECYSTRWDSKSPVCREHCNI